MDEKTYLTRDSGTKPQTFAGVETPEELGPITVDVTDGLIKRYAFCMDDYRSWHFDRSPFGGPVAHASLLANDLLTIYCTVYERVGSALHTEEELTFHAPVPVGETVTITGRYVDKYVRRGGGVIVMEAEARDSSGKLLISHRGAEVMEVHPGDVVGRSSAEPSADRIVPEASSASVVSKPAARLDVGAPLPRLSKTLTQDQISVYSFVGEHEHNFHNDLELAKSHGLDSTIAQGLQTAGYFSELCTEFFGADWFTSGYIKTKFLAPVYPDSTITVTGKIAGQESSEGDRTTTLTELWAKDQDGRLVAVAWAKATTELQ
ncbi:MaoC family dehydratase [Paramicrobacterium chengjingii]|uniref:MaoC family dehydratase n=1 Tax=Paramicrobacterium chengjingii TaxID=2769067 RepID=A0ABX6YHJ1_9MICO|nr:MaoC family dehydratase [Microbacterium chengjingii]QPZ38238.1 MaoC family dehydratase [Microbacterium chengjingii]